MRKRLISCLLSLVLICSLLPANVLAEELRDEPIPTAEEVLPETEEPKAPMKTEESEAPAEPETPLSASAVRDSGEGTLAEEKLDPEVFAAEIVKEGEDAKKFQTLTEAVAAVRAGDMIRLLTDVTESITISGPLTLNLNGKTLKSAANSRAVNIDIKASDEEKQVTIQNGTITGGNGQQLGGGIFVSGADLTLEDCTVSGNSAQLGGGGIYMTGGADVQIRGGGICENTAYNGGGIYMTTSSGCPNTVCTIDGTRITGNKAKANGAGIAAMGGHFSDNGIVAKLVVKGDTEISGNAAGGSGGGVWLSGNGARFLMENGKILENIARYDGGGICGLNWGGFTIEKGTIEKNTASGFVSRNDNTLQNGQGGGIYIKANVRDADDQAELADKLTLGNVTVTGNSSGQLGGGVCVDSYLHAKGIQADMETAEIYNNHAGVAGDDLFDFDRGTDGSSICVAETGSKWTLDDCGDQIDGWYEDGMPGTAENDDGTTSTVYGPRWDAHSEQNHVKACPAGTVEGALAVKAAHKVIVPMEPDEPDAPFHSKSKAATNLNSRYQSDVTLSLPAQQEPLTSDVVFVLDKSTSAALEEQALAMLETLRTQIRETGGKVKVGVVIFNREAHATGLLDLETQGDAIEEAIQQTISSGTNTHAGLLAGKALLDDDKTVAASRKYLIFVSDGISYLFNESPTAVAWTFTQPGDGGTEQHFAGPDNWKVQYGSDDPPANWAETLQSIRDKVEKQGTEYDYAYDSGASEYTPAGDQTKYANSVEKALCLTDAVYQAAKEEGYHCYAMTATQSEGRQYAWGPSFMAYLAGGEEVSFDTIRNEIVYLLGTGSCVVDEIGSGTDNKGNAYHFDFVDDAANLALTVGGRTYTVTKAEQVESGAVSTYWFGQPVENGQSGADYPFALHYYKDGTTLRGERYDECFVWEFHAPVTQFQRVELTYTVRLADPQTAAGTYGAYDGTGESGASALFTNNSAVLYSVDSTGVSGQPERFRRPTVSYTVSGSSGGGGGSGSGKLNTEEHYSYIIGYKDGLLRPYGEISRGEVAAIFFRMLTDKTRNEYWSQTNSFTDVAAEKWCNNAISTLFSMGIIDGYGDGAFRPDGPITRAAFTKMAVNFFDYHVKDYDGRFTDVEGDAWYAGYIQAAAELKLIEGFDDDTFRPDDYITRAQACAIINRTLGRVPDADRMSIRPLVTWPDCDEDAWYYADMMEATNSHDYQWITVGGEKTEKWTEKLPQRDWAALEHTWSTANSAKGGEVVG